MKVVHVATHPFGGATAAARRLSGGLKPLVAESSLYFERAPSSSQPGVTSLTPSSSFLDRMKRRYRRSVLERKKQRLRPIDGTTLEMFSFPDVVWGDEAVRQLPECDIVHLHWVAGFVDLGLWIDRLPESLPFVWTLHDMNPFTGGCHYDNGCGRYREACGECPHLISQSAGDESHVGLLRKSAAIEKLIAQNRLTVVTPSRWLAEEARDSRAMGKADIRVIPYGIDTDVFSPANNYQALRSVLKIPVDVLTLFFTSHDLNNPRKGVRFLFDALASPDWQIPTVILLAGEGELPETPAQLGDHIELKNLGSLTEPWMMSLAYNAADLFIIPTLADNLPNTVIESLACGTPVVGFDVGGVPDMVRPGVTGELAELRNSISLREAIQRAISDSRPTEQQRDACREVAVREYSISVSASRYHELYQELLHSS